jgi:predicted enzyme related to lactoylglutathione lyase
MDLLNSKQPLRILSMVLAIPAALLLFGYSAHGDPEAQAMQIYYLENVTPEVDAVCATYEKVHGIAFGEPDPNLGGARTARLANGGMIGVRPPLRANEEPVVRPYWLVPDIQAAVDKAADAGAMVVLPPMPLAGHGTCAIIIQGGVETGYWQR